MTEHGFTTSSARLQRHLNVVSVERQSLIAPHRTRPAPSDPLREIPAVANAPGPWNRNRIEIASGYCSASGKSAQTLGVVDDALRGSWIA
jgi:hypothetical protein